MGTRFLFGDSEPFPDGFDFLGALRKFVAASSRTLTLSYEADELERSLGDRAQEHLRAIEALQAFFDGLSDAITERAARSGAPQLVGPFASQLVDDVEALAEKARRSRAKDLDAEQVDAAARIRERRVEIRSVISDYLIADPLPVLSWALSLGVSGSIPHGAIILEHPGELTTSFALDVARDAVWGRARKVGELCPGLTMQVGFKKAFLRSSLHPDVVTLDEMVISGLELGPDSMQLQLRRKIDAPHDSFVVTVDPDERTEAPLVKITRLGERGEQGDEPFMPQGEDAARVEELGSILRAECATLLGRKTRLLSAQLDGEDVFERNLVTVLLQRISDRLAPTAVEVSRHSPNNSELSLKVERDDGRREELYLRKADLLLMVAALPPESLRMYQQLAFLPLPASRAQAHASTQGQVQVFPQAQALPRIQPAEERRDRTMELDIAIDEPDADQPDAGEPPARPSAFPPPKRRL